MMCELIDPLSHPVIPEPIPRIVFVENFQIDNDDALYANMAYTMLHNITFRTHPQTYEHFAYSNMSHHHIGNANILGTECMCGKIVFRLRRRRDEVHGMNAVPLSFLRVQSN